MRTEVEIYIRGKWNHSSLVRKQHSSLGWFSIQRETMILRGFCHSRRADLCYPWASSSVELSWALLPPVEPDQWEESEMMSPRYSGIHKTNGGKSAKKTAQKRQRTTFWRVSGGLWRVKLNLSAFLYRSARENQAFAHFKNLTPVVSKVSGLHPNPAGIKCFCSRSN